MTTQTLLATLKYMRYVGSTAPKNPSPLDIMGRRRLEQSLRASKRDLFGYRCHSRSTITRAQISLSADHVNLNCIEPSQGFASIDHALIDADCFTLTAVELMRFRRKIRKLRGGR